MTPMRQWYHLSLMFGLRGNLYDDIADQKNHFRRYYGGGHVTTSGRDEICVVCIVSGGDAVGRSLYPGVQCDKEDALRPRGLPRWLQ